MHYKRGCQRRKGVEGDLQEEYVIDEFGLFEGWVENMNVDCLKLKPAKDVEESVVIRVEKVGLKREILLKTPEHEPTDGPMSLPNSTCK